MPCGSARQDPHDACVQSPARPPSERTGTPTCRCRPSRSGKTTRRCCHRRSWKSITTVRLDLSPTVLRASSTVVPASTMMVSLPPMSSATLVAMPRRRDAASQTRNTRSRQSATVACDGAWGRQQGRVGRTSTQPPAARADDSRTGGSQVDGDLARWNGL